MSSHYSDEHIRDLTSDEHIRDLTNSIFFLSKRVTALEERLRDKEEKSQEIKVNPHQMSLKECIDWLSKIKNTAANDYMRKNLMYQTVELIQNIESATNSLPPGWKIIHVKYFQGSDIWECKAWNNILDPDKHRKISTSGTSEVLARFRASVLAHISEA